MCPVDKSGPLILCIQAFQGSQLKLIRGSHWKNTPFGGSHLFYDRPLALVADQAILYCCSHLRPCLIRWNATRYRQSNYSRTSALNLVNFGLLTEKKDWSFDRPNTLSMHSTYENKVLQLFYTSSIMNNVSVESKYSWLVGKTIFLEVITRQFLHRHIHQALGPRAWCRCRYENSRVILFIIRSNSSK